MTGAVWLLAASALAKPREVAAVHLVPPPAGGLCPGERLGLDLVTTDAAGKERKVKLGKGDYEVAWELGEVEGKGGAITMPLDPREAWGKEGTLTVTSAADSRIRTELAVPMRYDCSMVVDLSGAFGGPGSQGEDGIDTGQTGGNAVAGEIGEAGRDGPELQLRVTQVTEPRTRAPVLQVEIQKVGEDGIRLAAISPTEGELVVMANGGNGGQGGTGGQGGDGEPHAGGTGGTLAGAGGDGGTGGPGGRGGSVAVFVDPSAQGQIKAIVVENGGGLGGKPGLGGGMGAGGAHSTARPGEPGAEGRPGVDGPPPEVRGDTIGPLW